MRFWNFQTGRIAEMKSHFNLPCSIQSRPGLTLGVLCVSFASGFFTPLSAQTTFCEAILSRKAVKLSGTMAVDSFDSSSTALSTGGKYDAAKRADHGDIASLSEGVTVISDTGNTRVYGHFLTTPTAGVNISGPASVGSLGWVNGGTRGIQPGWLINTFNAAMPDISLPAVTFAPLAQNSGKVSGTNYSYVIGTGNYQSASLNLSSSTSICINGTVSLYLPGGLQMSGQSFIYLTPGSHLAIYLGSGSACPAALRFPTAADPISPERSMRRRPTSASQAEAQRR
jgi:hypothetical protein